MAAANPEEIQGLILLYPGFEIVEDAQALFATVDDIPETYSMFGWMTVGRTYFEDLLGYDVYGVIGAYAGTRHDCQCDNRQKREIF